MKLCVNPACSCNCEVEYDDNFEQWRFASGFKTAISKSQLKYFDPKETHNLCQACEGMMTLLAKLGLIPKIKE
jgi:hypothetical protein